MIKQNLRSKYRTILCSLITIVIFCHCTKHMEPQPTEGFDIQRYQNKDTYQALYLNKTSPAFTIIAQGKRTTGQLTEEEYQSIRELLQSKNFDKLREDSLLESQSLPYPHISIRERMGASSMNDTGLFVILGPQPDNVVSIQLVEMIDEVFEKYGE